MAADPCATCDVSNGGVLLFDPHAAALHADVRFFQIVERLGLVDYWRAKGPQTSARLRALRCASASDDSRGAIEALLPMSPLCEF